MSGALPSPFVVLLASVLKPVDDTRMYEKFAGTLRARPGTTVHVAGRQARAGAASPLPGVGQHPVFRGSRLSLGRLWAQWHYGQLLRRLRPDLVVVHAPELLPLTLLWQVWGRRRQFIYDIRENYALNVSTQGVYRGWTRRALAAGLRGVEAWAARRAAGVVLAEESYAAELPFLRKLPAGRVVVLENKYQPAPGEALPTRPRPLPGPAEPVRLLFSGTLSVLNGVRGAIALARELHRQRPGGAQLTLIGFCQQPELLRELEAMAAAHPAWLTLLGGAEAVPHAAIVAEIGHSHFGLLPYRLHPSTERCRPTKLFEYLAHGLPVLLPDNPLWTGLVRRYRAGLVVDFSQPVATAAAVQQATAAGTSPFYAAGRPAEALWATEAIKLWALLDSLA